MSRSVLPVSAVLIIALMTSCGASGRLYVERGTFERHRRSPDAPSGREAAPEGARAPSGRDPVSTARPGARPTAIPKRSPSQYPPEPEASDPTSPAFTAPEPSPEVARAEEATTQEVPGAHEGGTVVAGSGGSGDSMDPGPGPAYPTSTLEALARQMNTAETLAESGQLLDARPIWAYVSSQAPGSLLSLRASLLLAEDALERRDVPAAHGWLEQATLPDQAPSTAGDLETLSSLVDRRDRLISGLAAISLTPPKLREAEEAQEPGQGGDPGSVGVLLPLSGTYARYGQMAKRGLDIALEGAPFEVHVVDTAGEAQGAADGVRHLVENLHVIALVGPIGRVETRAAATEAADLGVPLISLTSYAEAVAGSRSTVRIRLSPSEHARAVVRHAVAELGLQRLAVVHPQSTFGLGVLEAFWSEGRRLGATLGVVHGLAKNGQTSRSRKHRASSVRQASASAVAAAAALKEAMAEEGPLASSFEALFLPETRAERIREIVRVLHGRGVPLRVHPSVLEREGRTTVQLLGLGGFNGRSAIDPGDHLTDNAIFAVGFAHDPERPENDRFVRSYLARHGEKPKKYAEYAAAAFDAGNLVSALQRAARAQPASPRRAARLALEKTRHVRGALGDRTLLPGGRLVGRSTLLTIQKDVIRVRLPEAEEATVRPRPRRPRKR